MEEFTLLKFEYVELYKLLKIQGFANSGAEAKQMIDEGIIKVNGEVETQRRKKIRSEDTVEFGGMIMTIKKRE
ncbi:MAG: RNA-binding S4 domain-containing protein [Cytophagales bacterium]|nr:RNA-binding S4 domain-containing protein [Cytophagales bacterium]